MIQSNKAPCSFCYNALTEDASLCRECAKNLMNKLDMLHKPCRVVPDGDMFGVWYKGEIRIHQLSLENARTLAAFVNSVFQSEKLG